MIAVALSSSLLCKTFDVAHYSNIVIINMKLWILMLIMYDRVQLLDKGHNSDRNIFELGPFLID
jgi:hypothetical protein